MNNPAAAIEVVISREQRRSLSMRAKPGLLLVKAPLGCSDRQIADFLAGHRRWIEQRCAPRPEPLVLGEPVDWASHGVDPLDEPGKQRLHRRLCRDAAERVFRQTLKEIGMAPPPLRVASLASAWGKCHSSGRVELHWRVGELPRHLARYVVCHELAHLAHFDHTPAFWARADELHPGARRCDRELNGWRL